MLTAAQLRSPRANVVAACLRFLVLTLVVFVIESLLASYYLSPFGVLIMSVLCALYANALIYYFVQCRQGVYRNVVLYIWNCCDADTQQRYKFLIVNIKKIDTHRRYHKLSAQSKCPICYDEFSDNGQKACVLLVCAHKIHAECLKQSETYSHKNGKTATCPVCRCVYWFDTERFEFDETYLNKLPYIYRTHEWSFAVPRVAYRLFVRMARLYQSYVYGAGLNL